MKSNQLKRLFETVVEGGYCVGCGNCAALAGSPVEIKFDQFGRFKPVIPEQPLNCSDAKGAYLEVCPFSDQCADEDQIASEHFGECARHHSQIGYYLDTFVGHVNDAAQRARASSGGMGTWIVRELFDLGMVDGVLHVRPSSASGGGSQLFQYEISASLDEIDAGAKSRYYPIEMSSVLSKVRERPGRYAVVGLPCFIKAVRLICRHDSELSKRIGFTVALFCGHLKSTAWAEMLAWQCGVEPSRILSIDFRKKLPDRTASDYGVQVTGTDRDDNPISCTRAVSEMYGTDWGLGFFKYRACDYCDDITGETADVAIGDAWLPNVVSDYRGTNVIVVRNPEIGSLLQNAAHEGRLTLSPIEPGDVVQSQLSNFRHRRTGLALRLYDNERRRIWHPRKRVQPKSFWNRPIFRRRIRLRQRLAELSHESFIVAKSVGEFDEFIRRMQPIVKAYLRTYPPKWLRRTIKMIRRLVPRKH